MSEDEELENFVTEVQKVPSMRNWIPVLSAK